MYPFFLFIRSSIYKSSICLQKEKIGCSILSDNVFFIIIIEV